MTAIAMKALMDKLGRLRGFQDYRVEVTYTYGTDKLMSTGNVLARDKHHAVSLFMMQEMTDPHGPESGWERITATATAIVR
jgi:hypothetical protein